MTMPARMLTLGLLAALALAPAAPAAPATRAVAPKVVYLAGGLSDEALIAFGAAVASRPDALLLLDSPAQSAFLKHFLDELKPQRLVAVGSFRENGKALSHRLGVKVEAVLDWDESIWPK